MKSVERVEWLFRGNHERGLQAEQPIQIAGVQFLPEGRSEPVVAVDLIDSGSLAGLHEQQSVLVDYEAGAPRTAYIRGATRTFARKNLRGMGTQIMALLAVGGGLLLVGSMVSRGWKRLTERNSS